MDFDENFKATTADGRAKHAKGDEAGNGNGGKKVSSCPVEIIINTEVS
jgi:hypothetical protein